MTVGELIEVLKQYDSNETIFLSERTHDYWRNVIVHEVQGVWQEQVKYSEYHRALQISPSDSDSSRTVLIID